MVPILDKQAIVQALVAGSTQTYSGHPMYPNPVPVNVQPASADLTMMSGGEAFKTFKVFAALTASGITESNRLIVDNDIYTVNGREQYDGPWGLQHMEFVVSRARP